MRVCVHIHIHAQARTYTRPRAYARTHTNHDIVCDQHVLESSLGVRFVVAGSELQAAIVPRSVIVYRFDIALDLTPGQVMTVGIRIQ